MIFGILAEQTKALEQPTQISASAQTQDQISASYGDFAVTGDASTVSFADSVLTISGGEHSVSMGEGKSSTNQAIKIVGATTLTLAGINIESTNGAAIEIAPNASFDVSILLADGSENELVGQSEAGDGWNGSAAIQKNGADSTGTLVIGVPNNSLGTGSLVATGGKGAAGIGGGYEAGTRNITFTGGSVKAYAGRYGAAIGGGSSGTGIGIKLLGGIITAESLFDDYPNMYQNTIGSGNQESFNAADNMLDGDVVLIASGPSAVLGGFSLNRGIYFEFNYGMNPFVPFTYSYVFENVTISENVELPL
ncbi:MAG: hypothetical protein K2L13_03000, partial [Opitutales bacterium]|nr:hypothetical protein [Opitutales bacterium]